MMTSSASTSSDMSRQSDECHDDKLLTKIDRISMEIVTRDVITRAYGRQSPQPGAISDCRNVGSPREMFSEG